MTTTADVPGRFDIGVNGTGFMLQEDGEQPALVFQSLPQQREQQGGANANIGEQVVNPEGFWRRSRDGWHDGAGQSYADRDTSNAERFRASQGVDVFGTKHQLSLLHSVDLAYTFAAADTFLMLAGDRVYLRDNHVIKYVAAPTTVPWTTTTVTGTSIDGTASYNVKGMATDGANIYIAAGANGIDVTTATTSTASNFATGSVAAVWYAKGRLLCVSAVGTAIYNPVAAGALPAALLTLPAGLSWLDVAEGPNFIYMLASDQKTRTLVYKTTIKPDGTALDVPTVAGELSFGVLGRSLFGYAGRMFVGTRTGPIMAEIDGDGNLVFGSRIPYEAAASATDVGFTGIDQFVYVTWPSAAGNGLLRLDLTTEILPATPAYATDIYTTSGAGTLTSGSSVATVSGQRVFCLRDSKAYVESATAYVTSGHVDSGLVALDLADTKTPVSMDVEAGGLNATTTITQALSTDRGSTFTTVGTWNDQADGDTAITGIAAARQFEVRTTLTGDGTATPTLYRWTLKTEPHIALGEYVIVRLRLFEDVVDNTGSRTGRTPNTDIALLQGFQDSREVVDLQIGSLTYTATLRDLQIDAQTRCASTDDGSWNSVAQARFKIVAAA